MKETAHHEDLRAPSDADPAELTAVRAKEMAIIKGWVAAASAAPGKYSLVDGVNFCYETTYTDANYKKKGWKGGACPATFNTIVSTSHETICKGHSEENVKYCPKSEVTILVTKKGVKGRDSMSSAAKPDGKTY